MAMSALLSKLRIPAASHRALPPFRSFSAASQDKLGSTAACATAKDGSPLLDKSRVDNIEWIFEADKKREMILFWCQLIGNSIAFSARLYHASSRKPRRE